jgi:ribose transport system ATP-binding protein
MIYQELTLVPHLTVEENVLLGAEPSRFGWIHRGRQRDLAQAALAELHATDIPLDVPVRKLAIAQQQLVEIARALLGRPRVLIMDEPTSSLPRAAAENLFQVIARLKERRVSIIYISHFLEECERVCDRYTVLRDGENVTSGEMASARVSEIIHHMVGRKVDELYPHTPHRIGAPVLTTRALQGKPKPRDVSFTLHAGEILGIAGLVGAGRTETLRALFGLEPVVGGSVVLRDAEDTRATPARRWQQGVGFLSEDRKSEGLMLERSVAENLLITRYSAVSRGGFISERSQRATARKWIGAMEVKAAGPEQRIDELSGGNQQKIALGRLMFHDARILLLDEPTRGIDVGSKATIYERIGQAALAGKAVIFVSSYLPELLGICDTIAVMCRGQLSAVKRASEWSEHEIIATAIGQTADSAGG